MKWPSLSWKLLSVTCVATGDCPSGVRTLHRSGPQCAGCCDGFFSICDVCCRDNYLRRGSALSAIERALLEMNLVVLVVDDCLGVGRSVTGAGFSFRVHVPCLELTCDGTLGVVNGCGSKFAV